MPAGSRLPTWANLMQRVWEPFTSELYLGTSLGDFEAVADAAQGFQILGMAGVELDFFTEAAYVDVDRPRGHERSFFPDSVEQLIAGEDAAAMGSEIFEQAEFTYRGEHVAALDLYGHGGDVNFEFSEAQHFCRGGRLAQSTQHAANAGHEFAGAEGLGDVVVSAQFQTFDAVGFGGFSGEKDDWSCREDWGLADVAAEFEAVGPG